MEPPSSDAEALRDQETAQVRASNGLLVAADEFCNLECSHQPVRYSAARLRGVGSASRDFGSMRRIRVRRLAHRFLRTFVASKLQSTPSSMGTNRAGECRGGDRRREADSPRSGLGGRNRAGPSARAPLAVGIGGRRCAALDAAHRSLRRWPSSDPVVTTKSRGEAFVRVPGPSAVRCGSGRSETYSESSARSRWLPTNIPGDPRASGDIRRLRPSTVSS